jgi:hypothetical protein
MKREEVLKWKQDAQKRRRETLKELKRTDNTEREEKSLIQILELAHQAIALANYTLDLRDIGLLHKMELKKLQRLSP